MKELDTLIEGYFAPAIGTSDIFRLVEQVMGESSLVISEAEAPAGVEKEMTVEDLLGSLSINPKAWGSPSDDARGDRAVLANYAASLGLQNANDPAELFRMLGASFDELRENLGGDGEKCSLVKSLSVIQILNTMSRIIKEIDNPSASGFIMEAFLSALFPNGKWESDASGIGLADFIIQGGETDHLISLKTISETGEIDGSKNNLLYDLLGSDSMSGGVVTYYILAKPPGAGALHVKKFDITPENVSKVTGITKKQIALWNERQASAEMLKGEISQLIARKEEMLEDFLDIMPDGTIPPPDKQRGRRPSGQKWVRNQLDTLGISYSDEQIEALSQRYDEYIFAIGEIRRASKAHQDSAKRMTAKQWGGDTTFHIDQNSKFVETVATLNIDPKVLYETANSALKSIVEQLRQIQEDYKRTVSEMHLYLSTLTNPSAESFKREVAVFDNSVQKNVKGDETCEPDFLEK